MDRRWLDVELTNICNAKCVICDRESMQQQGLWVMTEEVFHTLVEKALWYIRIISFWGIGDPFLDSNFWSRIEYLLQKIDKKQFRKQTHIFVYSKMQNMTESDFKKIRDIQDRGYNFTFYLSVFSFRKEIYEKMTGLKYELFKKNFKFLHDYKINYKINFTLTRQWIDDLPFLIKNFSNYQIEQVHNFRWAIDIQDFEIPQMKNIYFSARQLHVPQELQVSSFSITYTWDFRYTDEDSMRDIKIGNIQDIDFKTASEIYDKIEKWANS